MENKKLDWTFALVLLGCLMIVGFPVNWDQPILAFDDLRAIESLRGLTSFSEYWSRWSQNIILDITPIKDLSYIIELAFENVTGLGNFQLTNLILWIITLLVFHQTLKLLSIKFVIRWMVTYLVALHPVMHNSIFWVSGRKHILAALFIVSATLYLVKWTQNHKRRFLVYSGIFFLLSVGSHPINLLFPIFAGFWLTRYHQIKETKNLIYVSLISVAAIILAILNIRYYSSEGYLNAAGNLAPQFSHDNLELIGNRLLIWGRYIFQLFIPIKPSVASYEPFSILSYLGIGLIAILAGLGISLRKRVPWEWVVFLALPIVTITLKPTTQGAVETYLLTPLLGLGFLLAFVAIQLPTVDLKKGSILVGGVLGLFMVKDYSMAQVWTSDYSVWQYAYESEGSLVSKVEFAKANLNSEKPDFKLVEKLIREIRETNPNVELGYIAGKLFLAMPGTLAEKSAHFQNFNSEDPWFIYYWSVFDAQNDNFKAANERLKVAWLRNPGQFYDSFKFYIGDLEEDWTRMCTEAGEKNCAEIHALIEEERVNAAKGSQ